MDFKTFLENFDAIAEAPGGIPKLRSLILNLAVRGKLVPQHPEDKPAMPPKALQAEKFPYSLPVNWVGVKLGDVVDFVGGSQPAKKQFIYEEKPGYVRLIQIRDFKTDGFKTYVPEEYARRPFKEDDIMVGRYGPPVFQILKGLSGTYNVALMKATPTINSLSKDYLYYLLQEPRIQNIVIADSSRTAGQSGVRKELLNEIIVLVPPLAEQKRIVEKVDELMALRDRYEAAKQTRDNLRQKLRGSAIASLINAETDEVLDAAWAIMRDNWHNLSQYPEDVDGLRQVVIQLAVEGKLVSQNSADEPASFLIKRALEKRKTLTAAKKISKREPQPPLEEEEIPFELPSGWECIRFGEITDIVSGVTKGRKLTGRETASYPYLRVANVQRWHLALEVMKEIEISVEELDKYRLQIGDVLLTEGGDWDKLGRSAIWQGEIENCIHQNHVFRARPLDHGLLPEWAVIFTNSPVGRQYFESAAKRTTNLASINMAQLRFCPFPVPPEEEQKRIVAKVDELMKLCDQLEASLRQSQQRAESLAASAISHLTI